MNIKYLMIFITLLLIFLVLTISCYADMYVIKDIDGNVICLTNINKLSQQQIESGCTITLLIKDSGSSENQSENLPPSENSEDQPLSEQEQAKIEAKAQLEARIKELQNQPKADIVFIDSTNRLSESGNYYYLEGILKNKGKGTAYHVLVKIQALDKNGKLVLIEEGYTHPSIIATNEEATYKIMINYNSMIAKFDKTVYWSNTSY